MTILLWFSPASAPITLPNLKNVKAGTGEKTKEPPSVGEDRARDHVRNLKVHKSMEPGKIHPWVLRQVPKEVAKLIHHI